jgi:ABC-type transporter Mla subunit MlaD
MNPRRRRGSLAGSPLLIGALTTLIAVVAVYISYNANNGLPFTPTYNIKVALPESSGLQPGNEVRLSGKRIGVVSGLVPHQDPATGRVTAIASLRLEKKVQPLPADTTTLVESVSTIGLKYLELTRGHSRQSIPSGHTIPVSQSREPVQIQDFFNMFDKPTRLAIQQNTNTFGDAFAERGNGLNQTFATLRPLVKNAVPVLHNLASPQTGLHELFVAFDKTATQLSPVAEQQAAFFDDLDTFFTAWASAAPSLERTIEGGPAALRQAIHSLPYEAPFIEKSTEFMRLLRPSASVLRTSAGALGHAFQVGAVNLQGASELNKELATALEAFRSFSENPVVTLGLEEFTKTVLLGNPLLAGLAPAQTTCNYFSLAFRNLANLLSENNGVGTMARAVPIFSPSGPNNEGLPASAPANGGSVEHEVSGSSTAGGKIILNNYLHYNPYPNVAGPGQPKECEAGNEQYKVGETKIGNTPITAGTLHDATKRGENAFGEKYPSSTSKDFPAEGASNSQTTKSKSKSVTKKGK